MPQGPGTFTVGNVAEYVFMQFGDNADVQINAQNIVAWTNDAILEIVNKQPDIYQARAFTQTYSGQAEYSFPVGTIEVSRITCDGLLLTAKSNSEVEQAVGSYRESGVPQFWTKWGDRFKLWPTPSVTGKQLVVYYSSKPQPVTGLGDTLPLSDRYLVRIKEYVLSKAYELDEDYTASSAQRQMFEDKLAEIQYQEDRSIGQYFVRTDQMYEDDWGF